MLVSDFHYHLPDELIASEPLADRADSRLLQLDRTSGKWHDRKFREFPELLKTGDLVVFNNTRVFPARLYGRRDGLKSQVKSSPIPSSSSTLDDRAIENFFPGRIETLLTRQVSIEPNEWECLVRPGRKIKVGERLYFGEEDELQAEVVARGEFGERRIRFAPVDDFFSRVEKIGHIPLPPYISRADTFADRERYQTVYAQHRGSVAAPTAGLHFTSEILERIRERGIETAEITLHVGLGTFQPVRVERVEDHEIHSESYSISPEAARKINLAVKASRRVIAIGTTTARTLEYAALRAVKENCPDKIVAGSGEANIFIYPGYEFKIVKGLLTNFHLPESTLLMLVSAMAGRENVMRAYQHAVTERYRFYSYGDCMFLE